ncbi:MAG TPA: RNA polymerase sigma factor [Candidatus Polarisedimenticolia bacterium]|nr:RNA polymerase sigma factor [Candidatus Polarisedimenticolia bacterium]
MEAHDAEVVALARGGDTEAFRALVERHSRALFRLAYRITGNESDAEDVVQETFMKAHRMLHRYESRAGFGTWLHRIATNCALDLVRARARRNVTTGAGGRPDEGAAADPLESVPDLSPSPDRLALSDEVKRRVSSAMAQLTPNERAAFVLRHFEEQSILEIGKALGMRENAAKQSIFRAVRKLRRALAPLAGPSPETADGAGRRV